MKVFLATISTLITGMEGMVYVIGDEPTIGQVYVGKPPWRAVHHMDESREEHIMHNAQNPDVRYLPLTDAAVADLKRHRFAVDEAGLYMPPAQA